MWSGPTIRPHLGQRCVGSPVQRGGDMAGVTPKASDEVAADKG